MTVEIKVWDGLSPSRLNLSDIKNPDHGDYTRLVAELQKLQAAFLNTVQNVAFIPNLQEEFNKTLAGIESLRQEITALTPPPELQTKLESLECELLELQKSKDVSLLRRDTEGLRTQVDKHQLQVLKLQEAFATQVTSFQNRVWNTIKILDKEVKERMDVIEKKLESVSIQTRIQALQAELNK